MWKRCIVRMSYLIRGPAGLDDHGGLPCVIRFQVSSEALLAIVEDRLSERDFGSSTKHPALDHVRGALEALSCRKEERKAEGSYKDVEGIARGGECTREK